MSVPSDTPVKPSDPKTEPAAGQDDVIKKATHLPVHPLTSKSIDADFIREAERLAEEAKRDPIPATSVGWKQIGEWEEKYTLTEEDQLMDLAVPTILDSYLPEKFYGDWYHSVALFVTAGFFSFVLGYLRFSLAPVFFIVLASGIYYRTSIKKYRGIVREEIQKEFTVSKIENDYETMDWLNTFLDKYWLFLEPSVSQVVTEQVNPILASNESIPAFVKAIWIDQFTVGTKPPRVDFVKTLEIPKDDVVVMDWSFSFTPNSTADLSAKQLKNYVNQKVLVKATVFGITIPVLVENVAFKAWARVRLKMKTAFPHVETVSVSVMEPPQFDFVAKLLGESVFNWEILSFPGLLGTINELVLKFVGPMLFQPFSFQLNVPQLLSGSNTSVGILHIKARSAKGLQPADRVLGNTIDPYLTFSFSNGEVLAKTKIIEDTFTPTWNENIYVLVPTFAEPLYITVYDYNPDRKDKKLGSLLLDLNEVSEKNIAKNRVGQFLRNSKPVGVLLFDYEFCPALEPSTLPDGSTESPPDLNTGLAKIELTEIKNVKTEQKVLSSYTELYFNNELVKTTPVTKKNNNPSFSIPFEAIVTDRRKSKVKIITKDPSGNVIAASIQSLNNLIDRSEIEKEWVPFSKGEGEFKVKTTWKSVELRDVAGAGGYTEPIGVIRVLLNKAEGLRNLEKVGKSDPYARVLINGNQRARTDFLENNLDPVWNEALYIPVSSPNQKLTIEVMDAERSHRDRTLGSFDIKTSDFIEKDDEDRYVEYVDKDLRTGRLVHKKGPKGVVTYALSFYPAYPVKSLEDIETEQKEKEKKEAEKLENEAKAKNDKKAARKKKEKKDVDDSELEATSKAELTLSELLDYSTGVFVYTVLSAEYNNTNTYLQVYTDGHGYPDHASPIITHKHVTIPHTGDSMIKELEWATVTFRLVKESYATRVDEPIAESTIPVLSLLKNTYHQPNVLTLSGLGTNKLRIQTQWLPILIKTLPASDSITNSGDLDLDIISASNLLSGDSNGKSDPFVRLYVNDEVESFYKTKTKKKTLDPVWNEKTSVEVLNRVNTKIKLKVADWDFGAGQDDKLGEAILDLAEIDPISPAEYELPVVGPKGQNGGSIKVKTSFRPKYIVSVNKQSTNIGDVGLKAVGTGIGAGLGAGKTVIGGGVGVVGKVKKGIFGGKKGKEHPDEEK